MARFAYTDWLKIRDSLHGSNICTFNPKGKGACIGDSGGPLIAKNSDDEDVFVGVASWSIRCGEGYPDVYTNVFQHLNFIREQINT